MRCACLVVLSLLSLCPPRAVAEDRQRVLHLLPTGFSGWVCVDFGVAGAAPLPREGDVLLIRPRTGEVVETSDRPDQVQFIGQARTEVEGTRKPLPDDVYGRKLSSRLDSKDPVERRCVFFGDVDAADAAGDPPGVESPPLVAVSTEERLALIALYEATKGSGWKHRVGWLGPAGTECGWHGVECGVTYAKKTVVVGLDLANNNLVGTLPKGLEQLTELTSVRLDDNKLRGRLPDTLLQRWLAGSLEVSCDPSLVTAVSRVEYESVASSLLCGSHRIVLGADDRAQAYTKRCRQATPEDRTTFCEIKSGRIFPGGFARLGLLLERNGFFDLRAEYRRFVSDSGLRATRAIRGGWPSR